MALDPEKRLEAWVDRQLRQLPDRPAPSTLAPRVMALIRARVRVPWYRLTWWHWPTLAQAFSLLLVSTLLGGLTWAGLHASEGDWAATTMQHLQGWLSPLQPLWVMLVAMSRAVVLVVHQTNPLLLSGIGAVLMAMYLSCLALGTVVYRMAIGKRVEL